VSVTKDSAQVLLHKGRYGARLAQGRSDLSRAQALRHLCFRGGGGLDADRFDDLCQHVLVTSGDDLVCVFRLLPLPSGAALPRSYAGQFYDLSPMAAVPGPVLELGRFCIHPQARDPDILRVAWAALTVLVERAGARMLTGCSSFAGTDPTPYRDAFAVLAARHLADPALRPRIAAPEVVRFDRLADTLPDPKRAALTLPPLLRTYLLMGGRVSDHAVIDRDLDTLHVFTALDIAAIPPARARLLRDLAR
jgi:putative hemolysin